MVQEITASGLPTMLANVQLGVNFNLEEAANFGVLGGISVVDKFGRNEATSGAEDIWHGGGTYTGQPTNYTPELVTVVSTSTDDDDGGTGAITVELLGLLTSTSTEYTTETITLNGTTAVDSVNTWWRIPRARVLTAGTGGANAGDITVAAKVTTANVFCVMPTGFNRTAIAAYTVPYGKVGVLGEFGIGGTRTSGSGYAVVTLRARPVGGVYEASRIYTITGDAVIQKHYKAYQQFAAGTDVKVRCESVSAGAFDISAEFGMALVDV